LDLGSSRLQELFVSVFFTVEVRSVFRFGLLMVVSHPFGRVGYFWPHHFLVLTLTSSVLLILVGGLRFWPWFYDSFSDLLRSTYSNAYIYAPITPKVFRGWS
jgi:hypothetical protein